MDYANKDKYDGQWKDDMKNGNGKICYIIGVFTSPNDDYYEGEWVDNYMSGKGTRTYPNGDKYTGDFNKDIRDGTGIKILKSFR